MGDRIRRTNDEIIRANETENLKTYQYIAALAKSRNRVNQENFNYYNVRLTDTRLLTLLLAVCENKRLYLPDFVEELLTQALRSRDKTYRHYFENDNVTIDLQETQALIFGKLEVGSDYSAEQLERNNGKVK